MVRVAEIHSELEVFPLDLPGVDCRLHRQNVVERCHAETAAGQKADAEVLTMAVCRTQQPEQNVGFKKIVPVFVGIVTPQQEFHDVRDTWAALVLVLLRGHNGQCLTAIFLRQTDQAAI